VRPQSDDDWLRAARARFTAEGTTWDTSPDLTPSEAPPPAAPASELPCPYCTEPPLLRSLSAPGLPIGGLYCPQCYGIWMPNAALAAGISLDSDPPPVLTAARAQARCRKCFGHLDGDEVCRKCSAKLPLLKCPSCHAEMVREKERGVLLDRCGACAATWFDTGELAAVFDLKPAPTVMENYAAQMAANSPFARRSALDVGADAAIAILSQFF
jgi:Zn-finger nucleic acid-binding protein